MARTSKAENQVDTELKDLSIEEAFAKLEESIGNLEKDDISLEDSFKQYEEGMRLLKYCNEQVDKVEKKVKKLMSDGSTEEF